MPPTDATVLHTGLSTGEVKIRPKLVPESFAFTSPFAGFWLEHFYSMGSRNLFRTKIKSELQFRKLVKSTSAVPELLIEGNFIVERHGIRSLCREWGINRISSEDGFFPHYSTLHADPLGFCWESSLSQMVFKKCQPAQRQRAQECRRIWLTYPRHEIPSTLRKPFVLWPLQLIGDNVNRWDLALDHWCDLIQHFRDCLPREFQLVIKHHPRSKGLDWEGVDKLAQRLPNTCILKTSVPLQSLLENSAAVAGVNSTVLSEARLMFLKPTYVYGRSWFTSHTELFLPINHRFDPRLPPRFDLVEKPGLLLDDWWLDYADWYLYQLLVRQLSHDDARDWKRLRKFVERLSYRSFLQHGDDLFL